MTSTPDTKVQPHPAISAMRVTTFGIFCNAVLAVVKIVSGVVGNSYALIADGIESIADIATSGMVYFSLRLASKPPDENHPYGHGKAEPLATLIVSIGLCLAALAIAIQSVREIVTPHHAPAPFTLAVLLVVIVTKESLYRFQERAAKRLGSQALHTDAWHHRSDAITSLAVFIGISIALIGGPGWEAADDWSALFASGLIAFNAWLLLQPAFLELTDAVPNETLRPEAMLSAQEVPGVINLEKCLVRKMGFELYVDLHLVVDGSITVREGHDIAHQVKDVIRTADPRVADVLIHVEPAD